MKPEPTVLITGAAGNLVVGPSTCGNEVRMTLPTVERSAIGRLHRQPISVHAKTRLDEERLLVERTQGTETTPVILRLGMVYGRGILMVEAARRLARRRMLCVWPEPTLLQLISTPDFLRAVEAAIFKPGVRGIYHVGDEQPVTVQRFLDEACRVWGCPRPIRVPPSLIDAAAFCCEAFAMMARTPSPFTRDFVRLGRVPTLGRHAPDANGAPASADIPDARRRTLDAFMTRHERTGDEDWSPESIHSKGDFRMNVQDLHLLLDYHYWARDRLLDALEPLTPDQFTRDLGSSFRSVRDTAAHIYAAEWAWHSRWLGQSPTALLPSEMFPDVATLRRIWGELEARMRAFFSNRDETGINEIIEYKLISGHSGASILWQMLQHVVNHASYHRGQVVTMLRQLGVPPPEPMDMIAFYRLRSR